MVAFARTGFNLPEERSDQCRWVERLFKSDAQKLHRSAGRGQRQWVAQAPSDQLAHGRQRPQPTLETGLQWDLIHRGMYQPAPMPPVELDTRNRLCLDRLPTASVEDGQAAKDWSDLCPRSVASFMPASSPLRSEGLDSTEVVSLKSSKRACNFRVL